MENLSLIQSHLKKKKKQVTQLIKEMDIARNTFYYQIKKEKPDDDFIEKFNKATGDNLLNIINSTHDESVEKAIPPSNAFSEVILEDAEYGAKYVDLGDGQYSMIVPWIQEYGYAGYSRGFSDPEYIESMPTTRLLVNKQHLGTYRAITVLGDSMMDMTSAKTALESIPEGSVVFGREIQRHLWRSKFHIHRFKDYIINHKDGIQIKQIIKHNVEQGIITCHSLNPDKEEYPDFDLHLDDCYQICNIVSVQRNW